MLFYAIMSLYYDFMKKVIVTGAAGFFGAVLVERLVKAGYFVYAVVRPGSKHNKRISTEKLSHGINVYGSNASKLDGGGIYLIEAELTSLSSVFDKVSNYGAPEGMIDAFFHLAWIGDKGNEDQYQNVAYTLDALRVAHRLGCRRFIATGSQAEYGVVPSTDVEYESRRPEPVTAYGAAKVATSYLSKQFASEIGIEWIWSRIFSLIGRYEPDGRMLPDLYQALKRGEIFSLSSCAQNWDYLDVYDAADALIALSERGVPGEIYNIASGEYRPLREYTEELRAIVGSGNIIYGDDPQPFISLQPSVEKLKRDTGWSPTRVFEDSIRDYELTEE